MDSYGERERRRRREAQEAEWRRSMLDAGGFNPDELTEQGRRILAWPLFRHEPRPSGAQFRFPRARARGAPSHASTTP